MVIEVILLDALKQKFFQTFVYESRWQFFLDGFLMTLLLTFASFLGGTILGALLCGLRMIPRKGVQKAVQWLTNLLVQLPTLVLLMVFVYVIFSSTSLSVVMVVIFGLMLKCGAYLSEIFYTAVIGVKEGQAEAARSLGMTKLQAFLYITFPQSLQSAIPLYKNQFIITLQETSLVGTLAVQDITKASNIVTSRTLDAFFGLILISVVYLLIGFVCSKLLGLLSVRKHLGGVDGD